MSNARNLSSLLNSSGLLDTADLADNSVTTVKIPDAAVTPVKLSQKLTSGTSAATTSGTSVDFTGIPSWAKRVTVMLSGVSSNGSSLIQLQIGSGSIQTTGYDGAADNQASGGGTTTAFTSGLVLERAGSAVYVRNGIAVFTNVSGNRWVGTYTGNASITVSWSATSVVLSGALDRVRLTTVNGTDTFDAGSVNILYE